MNTPPLLNGCKGLFLENDFWNRCNSKTLCPSCKSRLLGQLDKINEEITFLESIKRYTNSEEAINKICEIIRNKIDFNCECFKCQENRNLLDHLVGIINRYDKIDERLTSLKSERDKIMGAIKE
jgi:hypothetical protein